MIGIKNNISVKSFYRFVEFASKICGSKLPHERYKQIALDLYEAQSEEEINVKRLSNAFLNVINNSKQTMSVELLNNIYFLLTNSFLDEFIANRILKSYYMNLNKDLLNRAVYLHNYIINLEIKRRIEFALLLTNYLMIKEGRGILVPFGSLVDEYLLNNRLEDELKQLLLFKQMETSNEGEQLSKKLSLNEIIELIKPHLEYIRSVLKVKTLCLYGSVVKGITNDSSDIDFLVEFDDGLIDYEIGEFHNKLIKYLKEVLNNKVDLLIFNHALTRLDIQEMNNVIVLINSEEKWYD